MTLALSTPSRTLRVEIRTLRVEIRAADPLVRHGLAALLAEAGAETDTGSAGPPEVALVAGGDLDETPALALVSDEDQARRARRAGALGVLSRDAEPGALLAALLAVAEGLRVDDGSLGDPAPPAPALGGPDALTPREAEVLALLAEGLPNKLVADRLGISERTARYHVAQILAKLDAQSRTEAVVTGARLGLVAL